MDVRHGICGGSRRLIGVGAAARRILPLSNGPRSPVDDPTLGSVLKQPDKSRKAASSFSVTVSAVSDRCSLTGQPDILDNKSCSIYLSPGFNTRPERTCNVFAPQPGNAVFPRPGGRTIYPTLVSGPEQTKSHPSPTPKVGGCAPHGVHA